MIVPEPKTYRHSDENMLPMINIVFLLLIFFMVAGVIAASEGLSVTPLQTLGGSDAELAEWHIQLGAEGQLALGPDLLARDELTSRIAARPADAPMVQIQADANTPSAELFSLMKLLNEAGVEKVRLLAIAK